ncbi:MAG TPA: hypothetical protein VGH87_13420 [Polyangiaceae bacterium]
MDPATLRPPPPDSQSQEVAPRVTRDETPAASGVEGVAQFRHKMAAMQSQLADVQRLLADEQRERAEEADQLARMLKHVATAERALAEERDVALQLGKSLTQREQEVVTLRGQVLDLEQRNANGNEQVGALERELADMKEMLVDLRATEGELRRQLLDAISELDGLKGARTELANAQKSLGESEREVVSKGQEIERIGAQLKQAHQKAFTATKQLESWKSESQRAIDQVRKELEGTIASLTKRIEASEAERKTLATEAESMRRELKDARARADSMRQHVAASVEILTFTSEALEAAEAADAEIEKVRAANEAKRRSLLEQALGVRNALKNASEDGPTLEVSESDWPSPDDK